MSRSSGFASHRFLLALVACLLIAWAPAAARAETYIATCGNLQTQINAVGAKSNHGEGDVIVLDGLCNGASLSKSSAVMLPASSAFTLQGAAGTTSGIDGAGMTGPLLTGEELGAITIAGLVFQNATSSVSASPVNLRAERLTLRSDSFLHNSHEGVTGGALTAYVGPPKLCPSGGTPGVTITGSTFRDNTNTIGGGVEAGGGAFVLDNCTGARDVLEGDVFEGNSLRANGATPAVGGGLAFASESTPAAEPLAQSGDVFAGNTVVDVAGIGNYGGAGEWLEGMSVTSVADRFSGNALPGTSGPNWSWGAGLGMLACRNTEPVQSTVEDAVVEGNSIGAGEPADLGGAGVYVGCPTKGTTANHLSVLDSTITENSSPAGGVAGVDGGPHDQLQIVNSIVAADTGGSETGGFAGTGGLWSATFSDVCNPAGTAPLAGAGNICTNPLLADNGNPASFDVHEISSSPTIDAGSNALVPSGLTTDAFGDPRILAGHAVCTGEAPKVVDMGAAEFSPAIPSCAPLVTIGKSSPAPPRPGLTRFVSLKTSSTGVALRLSCSSTDGQGCSGKIYVTLNETLKGKKVVAVSAANRKEVPARIAEASFSLPAGGAATFPAKLNSTGLKLLRHFRAISAFVLANEASPTSTPFIFLLHTVRFIEPRKHKHRSKQQHSSPHSKRH